MTRALLTLLFVLLSGCAAPVEDMEDVVVRFAVVPGPALAAPAEDADPEVLSPEDALLEVVTELSGESQVDFVFVPGPLLSSDDELLRDGLIGALGSLAGQLIVAVGPQDPQEQLAEAFAEGLPGHEGKLAYAGRRVGTWRAVALGPGGEFPDPGEGERSATGDLVLVQGGAPSAHPGLLVVRSGPSPALTLPAAGGPAVLELPSLAAPPHVYALAELREGILTVELRAIGPGDLPVLPPVRLRTPQPQ